jgi:folate-binding protein YgfZ
VNRILEENAVIGAVAPRNAIGVSGRDRASYLQGLLTNDIQALTPGTGCYAAWLTPQGRMLTDLHVFEAGDMILLDVPAAELAATLQRLDQFLFSEDVQLADLAGTLASVWIHGPKAAMLLEQVLAGAQGLASWPEYHNARATFDEGVSSKNDLRPHFPVVVARVSQLGVPGFVVYIEPPQKAGLERALVERGAVAAEPSVIEAARIEAGYPVFGVDMTDDTIPLEAGIEERAISLTKGCYVGQEVIIRVLHRGHGRVARRLVALRLDGDGVVAGAKIRAGDRDVGNVTSAAVSPTLGSIALGYVHRDFTETGTQLSVEGPAGRAGAVVSARSSDFARGGPTSSAAR